MKTPTNRKIACAAIALLVAATSFSQAANGVWTNNISATWSTAASWTNSIIADGAGSTADFSQLDLTAALQVSLDVNRNVGSLIFGDTDTNTAFGTEITAGGGALTLNSPATITVPALGGTSFAQISPVISGTAGLVKNGAGELRLAAVNLFTGGVTVNGGTLYSANATSTTSITNQAITLNNGTTLNVGSSMTGAGYSLFVPANSKATLVSRSGNNGFRDFGGGAGSSLSITNAAVASVIGLTGKMNNGGSISNLSISGLTGGQVRLLVNSTPALDGTTLSNTWVYLERITNYIVTGSLGSSVSFGALSGATGSRLSGGQTGAFGEYRVGAMGVDAQFNGQIDSDVTPTVRRGISLVKVGNGKWTLGGIILNMLGTNANAALRGGNITISNGVLALINSTVLPPGTNFGTGDGNFYATFTICTNAKFDVSGYTAGVYASAPLQKWQGEGAVVGNISFGASNSILSPGRDLIANTLTFSNNLEITNGTINFDISPSLISGNDLINVVGTANVGGPVTVNLGFVGGASSGSYTLLNAPSGLTGSVTGWTVASAFRGAPPTITTTATQVKLNVSAGAGASLVWRGQVNTSWDTGTSNWLNGVTQDKFYTLDSVRFDDSASVLQTNITIAANVAPGTIVVTNSANVYTFSGPSQIVGGTTLDKRGNGSLTILNANSYTGGTTNSGGGDLNIGTQVGALGSGPLTLNGANFVMTNLISSTLANVVVLSTGSSNTFNANGANLPIFGGSMSGSGQLAVYSDQPLAKGWDLSGNNSGFNGTITLASPSCGIVLRFRAVNSASASATYDLGNTANTILGAVNSTAPSTYTLGALKGGSATVLSGHTSSGLGYDVTWEIGGLNTTTTFDGVIQDGTQTGGPNKTALRKVGTGTLTLTGANTYTGNTTVNNGVLKINNPFLALGSSVIIDSTGQLELNFTGTNVVSGLTLAGVAQPNGTYGASGSGAANINNSRFAGTGVLQVGPTLPANITYTTTGNQINLDWPAGQGWKLQCQTNTLGTGLTGTWYDVPGANPPYTVDLDFANPTVFYRLKFP